jgi:hypothetical protein
MRHTSTHLHRLRIASAYLAVPLCVGLPATQGLAQGCNAGLVGPSDMSTSQVMETIRDRRLQVAQSCPAGTMPSASGMCVPTGGAVTPTASQAQPKAAPKAAPKQAAPASPAPAAPAQTTPSPGGTYGGYGSLKDDFVARGPRYGVWAEGYGDYEQRRDVRIEGTPGSQSERNTSWGVVSGVDHTYLHAPGEGIMIGGLAGYNETHVRLNGDLSAGVGNSPRTQDIDGAMLGLYGSYFHRGFAIDTLVRTDIFDFDQKIAIPACFPTGTGSTSLTDLLIASNIYYRRNMGHYWLEPTAGIRYIHSYFGDGAAALGVGDGDALRLQAGVRIGSDWVDIERRLWTVSFLGGIYSDVVVNGFTAGGPGNVALQTDEGKVRALGQLRAKVTVRDGLSYYGQAEVRGGEDYWGVGGKLGVRYEW